MTVRCPVTLLTGFLGAGKTTFLNRLLRDPAAGRVAVVVNEIGEIPIDGRLIVGAEEELVELSNGCICCTVRGDLSASVGRLLARRQAWIRPLRFERLVVEASGLASPGPVVQTFLVDPTLAAGTRIDGVVALASAPDIAEQLTRHPEAGNQLGYADVVLLNHADRAAPDVVDRAEAAIHERNGLARIERTVRAEADVRPLLDLRSFEPGRWRLFPAEAPHGSAHTVSLTAEGPLDLHKLKLWLQFVANDRAHPVWRIKGIVRCEGHPRPVIVHSVYGWLELGPGEGDAPDRSALVLIGDPLDPERLRRGWEAIGGDRG